MVIFLDIDGVLNSHQHLPSGYCGISAENVRHFNWLLKEAPDAKIVISSAWRYLILRGDMTLKGFEYLLLVHGVQCRDRVIGHTRQDDMPEPCHFDQSSWNAFGLKWRSEQVKAWINEHDVLNYVVLDDLPLAIPNQVQTDGNVGLTADDAHRASILLVQSTEQR